MNHNRDPVTCDMLVALLQRRPGLTCTEIGETLWAKGGARRSVRQSYARPAGRLVKRAIHAGMVEERPPDDRGVLASGPSVVIRFRVGVGMTAGDARKLKPGDWVTATFSGRGYVKRCEVVSVAWPTFTLRTKDSKGAEMVRSRRYESLGSKCDPEGSEPVPCPSWLVWPCSVSAG